MHSNHKIKTDGISSLALKHYGLNAGAILATQCFFDSAGKVTEITWAGQITQDGSPYWADLKQALMSTINKDDLAKDIMKLDAATGYSSIQSMHQLAEKHCEGVGV